MLDTHPIIHGLRKIRMLRQISQAEIAFEAKLCTTQINSYELGKNKPSINRLSDWAKALGYEIVLRRIEEK